MQPQQLALPFDRASARALALARMPERMRADQVAQFLGCSTDHVAKLRELDAIAGVDIRSPGACRADWRYFRASVAQYDATRPTHSADAEERAAADRQRRAAAATPQLPFS